MRREPCAGVSRPERSPALPLIYSHPHCRPPLSPVSPVSPLPAELWRRHGSACPREALWPYNQRQNRRERKTSCCLPLLSGARELTRSREKEATGWCVRRWSICTRPTYREIVVELYNTVGRLTESTTTPSSSALSKRPLGRYRKSRVDGRTVLTAQSPTFASCSGY